MRTAVLNTAAAPMATPAAAPRRLAAAAPPRGLPRLGLAARPRRAPQPQTPASSQSAALLLEQVQGNGAVPPEPEPSYSWFSQEWKEERRRKKGRTVRRSRAGAECPGH